MQAVHDGLGRARRGENGLPGAHVETLLAGLGNRRYIGQRFQTFGAAHGDGAQLAGLDVRADDQSSVEHHVHLSAHDILHGGTAALVGNMGELHAGLIGQQFQRHVVGGAVARRGRGQAARRGLGLAASQHVGQSLVGTGGRHYQHQRAGAEHGDGREGLDGVIVQLGVQADIDGVRADGAAQDGVAVGRGACRQGRAHAAAGAALVLDDHGRAQGLAQRLRNHARQGVGIAAGGERHQIGDGLARGPVALRGGGHGGQGRAQQQGAGEGMLDECAALHGACLREGFVVGMAWKRVQKRGWWPVNAGSYLRICPRSSRLRMPQCR